MSSPNKLTFNVKQHKDHQTTAPAFTSIFKKQITSNNNNNNNNINLNRSLLSSSNDSRSMPSTVSLDKKSATKPINTNRYTIAFAAQENVEQFYQNLKLETLNSVC